MSYSKIDCNQKTLERPGQIRMTSKIFGILFLCVFLGACGPTGDRATSAPTNTPVPVSTATVEAAPTATLTPQASPTAAPTLWIAPDVPSGLIQTMKLPDGISQVKQPESASLRLEVSDQNPVSRWVYAVVAPFSTITDTVSFDQVLGAWQGKSTGPFTRAAAADGPGNGAGIGGALECASPPGS